MDEIQKTLIKIGRKDIAQKYYEKIANFQYYKFHQKGDLHRNNLLDTLENNYGITFKDYNLSPTGIQAKNKK